MNPSRLPEDLVYIRTKRILQSHGFTIIAGQPPRGTDHLPVIEIKAPGGRPKGSGGAYKPDLVALRTPWLLLGECKPEEDLGDIAKLREILGSDERRMALEAELACRNLTPAPFELLGFIAHGPPAMGPLHDLGRIVCLEPTPLLLCGREWPSAFVWDSHSPA